MKNRVTCPGIWLCSADYLEVTIKTLGYYFRTGALEPHFPLLCHDHYKIEGYFKNAESIDFLTKNLHNEPLEITLWQCGRRLSYYQGVVMDLIQYIEPKLQCSHTNTTRLLMKTTPAFPGIIAPKVELLTKFYIGDKILNLNNNIKYISSNISTTSYKTSKSYSDVKDNKSYARNLHKILCNNSQTKLIDHVYHNSSKRRLSGASSCSLNTPQTLVGTDDGNRDNFGFHNNDQCCELCRKFQEVFQ